MRVLTVVAIPVESIKTQMATKILIEYDIFMNYVEFSNVQNGDRSCNSTELNLPHKHMKIYKNVAGPGSLFSIAKGRLRAIFRLC